MPRDPRIGAAASRAATWLTPPAQTIGDRAAAAAAAADTTHEALRLALRAGLIDRPADPLARRLRTLRRALSDEAEALAASVHETFEGDTQ